MKSKKTLIAVAVIIVVCILLAIGIVAAKRMGKSPAGRSENRFVSEESVESSENEKRDEKEETSASQPEVTEENGQKQTESQSGELPEDDSKTDGSALNESEEQVPVGTVIPGELGDTGLVIKKLDGYDGIFVEDGSNNKVQNVSTILVKNNTGKIIQYAKLIFKISEEKQAEFTFSSIPKGAEVMVFEQNRLEYSENDTYTLSDQIITYLDEMSCMEDQIGVVTKDDNSITVTNKSKQDIDTLRLFYKYKYKDGTYIGGITFTAKIENLEAGKSISVSPKHFDHTGSEIMMIAEYDE